MNAKKAVAVAIADEKKLHKQYNVELDKSKEWERKAMVAVRAGDDNLARQALMRKQEHETVAQQFQTQWLQQKQAVEKLKDALRLLNNKIEEAKRKKNILIARKKRAEAQQQIAATMSSLGDTSAFDTFERMADQINMLEAEAEAGAELAGEISGDALEAKFLQLESSSSSTTDDDLAELKAKMGLLEGASDTETKKLTAGEGGDADELPTASPGAGKSLSAEDLKELEDLDLSGYDLGDEPAAKDDEPAKEAAAEK